MKSPLAAQPWDVRSVGADSFLLQQRDLKTTTAADLKIVTKRQPTEAELKAMLFGWRVVKHLKSNAILYVGEGRTLGTGAGQMSRVDSSRIAVWKAGEAKLPLAGSVVCSDAFFPFPDGLLAAAEAGATAAIQPGGSVKDAEVIAAADARGHGDGVHRRAAFPALKQMRGQRNNAQPCEIQSRGFLFQQPVNQDELEGGDGGKQQPDEKFAEAQAALARGGEPELDFGGAEGNDVAVAQPRGGLRLFVDGGKGFRRGVQSEAFCFLKFQREVVVPNAGVVEHKSFSAARPMRKGKRRTTWMSPAIWPERMRS